MNVLPDDVLLEIFSHLNTKNKARISRVCRRWLRLCRDHSLWKSADMVKKGSITPIKTFIRLYCGAHTTCIHLCSTESKIRNYAKQHTALMASQLVPFIYKTCINLESFSLELWHIKHSEMLTGVPKTLIELRFLYCTHAIGDQLTVQNIDVIKHLTSLELIFTKTPSSWNEYRMNTGGLKPDRLENLKLYMHAHKDREMAYYLYRRYPYQVDESYVLNLTSFGFEAGEPRELGHLDKFVNLTTLCIYEVAIIKYELEKYEEWFMDLLTKLTKLRSLLLGWNGHEYYRQVRDGQRPINAARKHPEDSFNKLIDRIKILYPKIRLELPDYNTIPLQSST